jgi:hypothetical protein
LLKKAFLVIRTARVRPLSRDRMMVRQSALLNAAKRGGTAEDFPFVLWMKGF